MSYQKNDVLTVKIEDMGHDGEGIGKCEGYTLFVKDTVIGDLAEVKVIKAKKNYGYARLMRLIEPSAHRVEPVCPVARPCGGCQLQMLDYAEQLRFKEKKIAGNLQRIGGMAEIPMEPIVGMENPFRYRNKAQFPIGQDRNGKLITGFYAGRTHQIMENRNCYLGVEQNEEILNRILAWMEENGVPAYNEETGKGLVRHVLIRFGFMTKEIMVCLVVNGKKLPAEEKLIKSLTELEGMTSITLSVNRERTNVIMGKEIRCLWGQGYITDYIGTVKYRISPLSFYQVNPAQTEKLYGLALEYADLTGNETVWDLYCGIGTISLFLAQKAKKSTVSKSSRRQSRMRRTMRKVTRSKTLNFSLENRKRFFRPTTNSTPKTTRANTPTRTSSSSIRREKAAKKTSSTPWPACSRTASCMYPAIPQRWHEM